MKLNEITDSPAITDATSLIFYRDMYRRNIEGPVKYRDINQYVYQNESHGVVLHQFVKNKKIHVWNLHNKTPAQIIDAVHEGIRMLAGDDLYDDVVKTTAARAFKIDARNRPNAIRLIYIDDTPRVSNPSGPKLTVLFKRPQ